MAVGQVGSPLVVRGEVRVATFDFAEDNSVRLEVQSNQVHPPPAPGLDTYLEVNAEPIPYPVVGCRVEKL